MIGHFFFLYFFFLWRKLFLRKIRVNLEEKFALAYQLSGE